MYLYIYFCMYLFILINAKFYNFNLLKMIWSYKLN